MPTPLALLGAALLGCTHPLPPEPAGAAVYDQPHHILTILAVRDLEAAAAFYQQAFGWSLSVDVPVYKELVLPDGRGLGLYARGAFARNVGGLEPHAVPEGAISGTELYLHVPDLGAAIDALRATGARELSPRAARPWGDEAAYYADPDGNVLVVAAPLSE
jgi:lactoylglutathione lyase